jgi:ribosomal protein S26
MGKNIEKDKKELLEQLGKIGMLKVQCIGCKKDIPFDKALKIDGGKVRKYICKKCLKKLENGALFKVIKETHIEQVGQEHFASEEYIKELLEKMKEEEINNKNAIMGRWKAVDAWGKLQNKEVSTAYKGIKYTYNNNTGDSSKSVEI